MKPTDNQFMTHIEYYDNKKYQLAQKFACWVPIYPEQDIVTDFARLNTDGFLVIDMGNACDGPSGPTIDTKNSMRGAWIHDVLYDFIEKGLLPKKYRKVADKIFKKALKKDGMEFIRRNIWFLAVKYFGASSADPNNPDEIITAPDKQHWGILDLR
jgi:hypothetical protein